MEIKKLGGKEWYLWKLFHMTNTKKNIKPIKLNVFETGKFYFSKPL